MSAVTLSSEASMMPPSTAGTSAAAATIVADPSEAPDSSNTPARDSSASAETQKPVSERITGFTPEMVFEELKKSGYLDQLRRQMHDAFVAAPASSAATQIAVPSQPVAPSSQVLSNTSENAISTDSAPPGLSPSLGVAEPTTGVSNPTATSSASASSPAPKDPLAGFDIGSSASFLKFVSSPLRQHVETHHDDLRLLDARGQSDKVAKMLETEPVDYLDRETLGEATVYDLLTRHIVMPSTGASASSGILHKDGKLGKDMNQRIADAITEMMNPGMKDADEDEEDDDDEEAEDEGEKSTLGAEAEARKMDESGETRQNAQAEQPSLTVAAETEQPSHADPGQASSQEAVTRMEED